MKIKFNDLGINLVLITCICIAGVLAYHGRQDWGWFLFAGLIAQLFRD